MGIRKLKYLSWQVGDYKDSNNILGDAFILLNDPNLAAGLIQISGHISLKKLNNVLYFDKYKYRK